MSKDLSEPHFWMYILVSRVGGKTRKWERQKQEK